MSDAHLQRVGFVPHKGRDRTTVTELYHIPDIDGWNHDNTGSAVFSKLPYQIGTSHPDPELGAATCRDIVLQDRWTSGIETSVGSGAYYWHAKVVVYFSSSNREAFNPTSSSSRYGSQFIEIPMWEGLGERRALRFKRIERPTIRRLETRHFRTAVVTESVRHNIANVIGSVYYIGANPPGPTLPPYGYAGAIPYIFRSPSITDVGNGLTRIIYPFETTCRIRGRAGNPPSQTAIPDLDYLETWDWNPVDPTEITRTRWQDQYPWSGQSIPLLVL